MPRSERDLLEIVYRRSAELRLRRRAAATATVVAVALVVTLAAPPLLRSDHPTGVDMVDRPTAPSTTATVPEDRETEVERDTGQREPSDSPASDRRGHTAGTTRQAAGDATDTTVPSGRIVFENGDQGYELYTISADGSTLTHLGSGWEPRWSPDGTRVAFVDQELRGASLSVVNADGTGRRRVIPTDIGAEDPRWSPDGTRLAFVAYRPDPTRAGPPVGCYAPPCGFPTMRGQTDISVVDVDTGVTTSVTSGTDHEYAPSWSPDGTRIAFARVMTGGHRVHSVRPNGREERGHSPTSTHEISGVAWSPLGPWIAYTAVSDPEWSDRSALSIAGADREEVRLLDPDNSGALPVWSPDGRAVAFTRWGTSEGEPGAIVVVDLDGSMTRPIAGWSPTFSPDGRHLAYCRADGLWRAERGGSNPTRLLAFRGCGNPEWSPTPD